MHDPEDPTHTNVHPDSQTARQAGLLDVTGGVAGTRIDSLRGDHVHRSRWLGALITLSQRMRLTESSNQFYLVLTV
ncbi:hypothetical protein M433DRAFT_8913 [Acidomyces richmondensis BFW]|nr:hypothetical protein M433DRAFT_10332 [Acidomyces richmondensis BFW]KYG40348.1 hypothetical protein M433DRAFT_8913 [Acidomyces richmondensis BFW]